MKKTNDDITKKDRRASAIINVHKMPRKAGKALLLLHLKGQRLTRDDVIKAKCFECVGGEAVCRAADDGG